MSEKEMASPETTRTKKSWSKSFGSYGSTFRVAERIAGGILYLFWIDNLGKLRKRSLGHRKKKRAERQAKALADKVEAQRTLSRLSTQTVGRETGALTLPQGIKLALDPDNPDEGMYPEETEHTKQAKSLMARAVAILGEHTVWLDLRPRKVRALIRALARQSEDGRGARTAEYMVDVLFSIAAWLRDEDLIPAHAATTPGRNWKAKLKQEWEALTKKPVVVSRPRHLEEEVKRLFAALPEVDPRFRLLVELSAELRVGQGARAKRSDLDLGKVGGFGVGRFTVRGVGRKGGEVVDLHPELRALVDEILATGYLSEVEAMHQAGKVADYYLFPKGKLRGGKALVERGIDGPLSKKRLNEMFHALEKQAGVEHQQGRAWYGLRRHATDLAADFESDNRVLDRVSGHRDSETRERIYQDRESERLAARAAQVRRKMRKHLAGDSEDSDRDANLAQT